MLGWTVRDTNERENIKKSAITTMAGPSLIVLEMDGHKYFLAGHEFGLELDVTFILLAASLLKEILTFSL
jgi:hypothetical protein